MIKSGAMMPQATFKTMKNGQVVDVTSDSMTAGKTIIIFAIPGPFTPTCSNQHLPGFLKMADKIKSLGVDKIYCVSVSDAYVMDAWARSQSVGDKIIMLADGSALFTKAMGMALDLTAAGMGMRSQRYAMLVKNGTVMALNMENKASECLVSAAEGIMPMVQEMLKAA